MSPYASLVYVIVLVAALLPLTAVGLLGRASARWSFALMAFVLVAQYADKLTILPGIAVREVIVVAVFGVYQFVLLRLALRGQRLGIIPLAVLPLVIAKLDPAWIGNLHLGFAGISYVTFRVLDVLWSIASRSLKEVALLDWIAYAFFVPTISAGPIDRFKRFREEWRRTRTRAEFLDDLEFALPHLFRGLLYKNIIAALIERHLLHHAGHVPGLFGVWEYAWVYSLYLFFDFAGYSAFAIGVGCWFGVRSPANFNLPFLATNIRDFWNRWHMSLSLWFRDHIYSRFLMHALKNKWFKSKETVAALGYFVSFGIMGLWHGFAGHYIAYGLYHATLMAGYDVFLRWKKNHPERCNSRLWMLCARVLTLHAVVFGMWIFSGHHTHTTPKPGQVATEKVEN